MGYIAETTKSMALAMLVPMVAYIYILYFSVESSGLQSDKNKLNPEG
jgi:fucose permease